MYMYRRIVEAKLFIDKYYAQKIELDNISDEACFSKYHFLRLFKQAYGLSPHKYLTEVRIQQAKKMLQEEHSIATTCYAVGFESIPSFANLFRRYVGISPKAFVEQKKLQQTQIEKTPFRFIPNCFAENFGRDK